MYMIGFRMIVTFMMILIMILKVEEGDREFLIGIGIFWIVLAGDLVILGRVFMMVIVIFIWFCGRGEGVLVLIGIVIICLWLIIWILFFFCIVIFVFIFIEMIFCVVVLGVVLLLVFLNI